MSGEQGWEGTERFSRGCNAQISPSLLVLYRIHFPSASDSMPQRLRPTHPQLDFAFLHETGESSSPFHQIFFITRGFNLEIALLAETNEQGQPGQLCASGFRYLFSKLIDLFDSQCRLPISLRVFGPLFRDRTAEIDHSPPVVFVSIFYLWASPSKK